MKRKTRKFASGGDIITGLGAVLVGKALYDKYKEGKGKDDEDSDYAKKVREFRGSKRDTTEAAPEPAKNEEKVETKREPSAGEKRAMAASQGRPELIPEGTTDADKATMYSDNYPVAKSAPVAKKVAPKKVEPKKVEPKKVGPKKDNVAPAFKGEGMAGTDTRGGSAPKSVVFKKDDTDKKVTPVKTATINKVLKAPASDLSVPKALDLKGTNKTVYGTDTTSVFQKKAAQERADKEAKAKKEAEAEKRRRNRPSSEEMMTQSLGGGFKRGGTVKKYASGGSVKTAKPTMRSASSRADGIAIRGKTRA